MGDSEKNAATTEQKQSQQSKKDGWDKADIISKFTTALVIGLIGVMANVYLTGKEKQDNSMKLYTQLLSNKEMAENTLRKDMFGEILKSFIGDKNQYQTGIEKIREMSLSLELLTRNFHESLDIKPLFKHLFMEIILQIVELRKAKIELEESLDGADTVRVRKAIEQASTAVGKATGQPLPKTNAKYSKEAAFNKNDAQKALTRQEGELQAHETAHANNAVIRATKSSIPSNLREQAVNKLSEVKTLLTHYTRERNNLVEIAKRVSRKQCEILEDVAGKITFEIPLKDIPSNMICMEYTPNDQLPSVLGNCVKKDNQGQKESVVTGYSEERKLLYKDDNGKELPASARYFKIQVHYAYPKWRRVYVEVDTWGYSDRDRQVKCEKCHANKLLDSGSFWLEYFDFPLVDNTFINNEQRYSVVLEDFNEEKAIISLLYYPASYAGLKEKTFYNNQMTHNLLNEKFFRKGAAK